jgi:hypothetical protein
MTLVQMIGVPVACPEGTRDRWRDVAGWVADQLRTHFGDAVEVAYFDLFDPACPSFPEGSQIPVILIDGELFSSGGKVSLPAIRRRLEGKTVAESVPAHP